MIKDMDKFSKEERFFSDFLKHYTALESQLLAEIEIISKQAENNVKLSERFGALG
jgi:hypothetical protein